MNLNLMKFTCLLVTVNLLAGCSLNGTRYFADAENDGLAIFSNTGNNLLTCYINGEPWRTVSRQTKFIGPPRVGYEVYIRKQTSGVGRDTLSISWEGYFGTRDTLRSFITARIAVDNGFTPRNLNAWQGQRITVAGNVGYFVNSALSLNNVTMGTGHLYFHTLRLDSASNGVFTGYMSGLMDADFGTEKITNGRFDHAISTDQVQFQ